MSKRDHWTDHHGKSWLVSRSKGPLDSVNPGHRALRVFVLVRDRFRCCGCGDSCEPGTVFDGRGAPLTRRGRPLVVDHIEARVNGGTHHPSNLRALCDVCNSKKAGLVDRKLRRGRLPR